MPSASSLAATASRSIVASSRIVNRCQACSRPAGRTGRITPSIWPSASDKLEATFRRAKVHSGRRWSCARPIEAATLALVPQDTHAFGDLVVVRRDGAPFSGGHVLGGIEGEAPGNAEAADPRAAQAREGGLGRVLAHGRARSRAGIR